MKLYKNTRGTKGEKHHWIFIYHGFISCKQKIKPNLGYLFLKNNINTTANFKHAFIPRNIMCII